MQRDAKNVLEWEILGFICASALFVGMLDVAMPQGINMRQNTFTPQGIQSSNLLNLMRIGDGVMLTKCLCD
jgi:hypothetical protein